MSKVMIRLLLLGVAEISDQFYLKMLSLVNVTICIWCISERWYGANRLANTKVQPIRLTSQVQEKGIELHQPSRKGDSKA